MYNEHIIAQSVRMHAILLKIAGEYRANPKNHHDTLSSKHLQDICEHVAGLYVQQVAEESGAWEPELSIMT